MNSRERVRAALAHQTPDRIPLDLGATESSGITGIAYNRLLRHLGMTGTARMVEPYQQVVLVESALIERFGIDTVPLHFEPRCWKAGTLGDGSPCQVPEAWNETILPDGSREVRAADGRVAARMPSGGFYFEPGDPPLASIASAAAITADLPCIARFDLPEFSDESWAERATRAKALRKQGKAVVGNLCCHFLAAGQFLRGYTEFMCDLVAEKTLAHVLLDALCEVYLCRLDDYLAALGEHLDVILVNDDLGTQQGPMLSPELYREMIKPYQRRLFGRVRQRFQGWLLLHSCGAISEFLPDLIELGIQAVNPVQISARGMEPDRLKREFGKDLTFWGGGIDTQRVLNHGTPAQVRRNVQDNVRILGAGGGYVFTQVHNIQPDVPPENVVAMIEALRDA